MFTCEKQIYLLPNVPHDLANTPETKKIFEDALNEIFEQKFKVEQYSEIVEKYLKLFPDEKKRLQVFLNYIKSAKDNEICDWNNANVHITCGAFLYSEATKKFPTLYHKDIEMFLYAGGHLEKTDETPLMRAALELVEESGISKAKNLPICKDDTLVPIDIDINTIPFKVKIIYPSIIILIFVICLL